MKLNTKDIYVSLLLLTMASFGMQRETSVVPAAQFANLQGLPSDVKGLIINAIIQSSSLDEAVEAISNLTQLKSKQFYSLINNPKTIEAIIKNLATKFRLPEALVAAQLNLFGSQQWLSNQILQNSSLGVDALFIAIELHDVVAVKNLLKAGVNPNGLGKNGSPLDRAWGLIALSYPAAKRISEKDKAIMKALIDAGAWHHGSYGSSVVTDPIIKELEAAGINRWKNIKPITLPRLP